MRYVLSGVAVLAILTAPVVAEMRYDEKLEKAAMAIVAEKIGDIRGGFSYAQKVQLVVRQDETRRAAEEAPHQTTDGLVQGKSPQADRPFSSITAF